jgi:hypothetical protein
VSGPGTFQARVLVARGATLMPVPVVFEVQPAANTAQLAGRLTDQWHGNGIYGRVLLDAGPLLQTDVGGQFTATLPYGTYALTASANGYFGASTTVSLTGPVTATLALLADLPRLESAAAPISATLAFGQRLEAGIAVTNTGTQALSLTATVTPLEWITEAAGEPGAPLYDLSATEPLSLSDDLIYPEPLVLGFGVPMFGGVVNRLYLSTNGWVSATPPGSPAPWPHCLPSVALPPNSLAPFWADLDPSVGGAVRAGPVDAETYVVSFEGVPHWQEEPTPDAPTYTFQLVLRSSGQVEYRYGAMGPLPTRWSVGMAYDGERGERLACNRTPAELANRLWRLHPQPAPGLWLGVTPAHLQLAPGETRTLSALLTGAGYAEWHPGPFMGVVRLTTNDPSRPVVDVPATATVGKPPHQAWYPLIGR